jgi:hypothetical protein
MAGQRLGFALLLVQDRVVGEGAFLEGLESKSSAEGQHQNGEHANGNRATRPLWR